VTPAERKVSPARTRRRAASSWPTSAASPRRSHASIDPSRISTCEARSCSIHAGSTPRKVTTSSDARQFETTILTGVTLRTPGMRSIVER